MKIAILGKGGSGKSTVSWLLAKHLSKKNKVLVIDADHNMDLMANLGITVDSSTPAFYKANDEIRKLANMPALGRWAGYMKLQPLLLNYNQNSINSELLNQYIISVSSNLDLITMGLGEDDIMYGDKCAHGLSAHLKYILPTIQVNTSDTLLIDSVAGADMLNYGLYYGCDFVCVVVEGHKNSIKVATQLLEIAKKQSINLKFILNKYNLDNQIIVDFEKEFEAYIIGKLPNDPKVLDLDFDKISPDLVQALDNLTSNMRAIKLILDLEKHAKLSTFENQKAKMNSL